MTFATATIIEARHLQALSKTLGIFAGATQEQLVAVARMRVESYAALGMLKLNDLSQAEALRLMGLQPKGPG